MENRNILIGLGTGLVAGLLGGFGLGYWIGSNQGHTHPAAPAAAPAPGMPGGMPGGMPPGMGQGQVEAFGRINATKAALERDPKNFDAWVQLGNDYFDTHQPQASVDAYAKAIELNPKHPRIADVLTDQGVMLRELKAYDKALANFKKANAADPKHLPSLLNIGIVYANDLKDTAAARKAWTRLVELAPDSPQGQQAKALRVPTPPMTPPPPGPPPRPGARGGRAASGGPRAPAQNRMPA